MPKFELRRYFDWFVGTIPERIAELTKEVREISEFKDWEPDFSPSSLDALGLWFAKQVGTRERTEAELQKIRDQGPQFGIESKSELTNRTFSLAMDIGMYFGQLMLTNHPSLRWDQRNSNKRFAHYGQPVLVGFEGGVPLNPVHIAVTLAYGLAKKRKSGQRLRELYEHWSTSVVGPRNGAPVVCLWATTAVPLRFRMSVNLCPRFAPPLG